MFSESQKKLSFKALFCIFCFSLLLRFVVFFNTYPDFFGVDSMTYYKLALSIPKGAWPAAHTTPIYPLLITLVFLIKKSLTLVVLLQIFIDSAIAILLAIMLFCVWESKVISYSAAIAYAASLQNIRYANFIMTETLFTFMFLILIWCLILFIKTNKLRHLLFSALIWGVAVLTRNSGILTIYLPIVTFLFLYKSKISLKTKVCYFVVSTLILFLVLLPWSLINYKLYKKPMISNCTDFNLIFCEAPAILTLKAKPSLKTLNNNFTLAVVNQRQKMWQDMKIKYNLDGEYYYDSKQLYNVETVEKLKREIIPIIYENIGYALAIHLYGMYQLISNPFHILTFEKELTILSSFYTLFIIFEYLLMLLSIIGAIKSLKYPDKSLILLFIFSILFYLLLPGPHASERFTVPVRPYICALAGIGIKSVINIIARARQLTKTGILQPKSL